MRLANGRLLRTGNERQFAARASIASKWSRWNLEKQWRRRGRPWQTSGVGDTVSQKGGCLKTGRQTDNDTSERGRGREERTDPKPKRRTGWEKVTNGPCRVESYTNISFPSRCEQFPKRFLLTEPTLAPSLRCPLGYNAPLRVWRRGLPCVLEFGPSWCASCKRPIK